MQFSRNGGHRIEKLKRRLNGHVQHLGNVFALVQNFQSFAVVTLAVADIARHIHVGQEVHFHFHHAVALTSLAASAAVRSADVKAKATGAIAAFARYGYLGHEVAYVREHAGVSSGVAARCTANGRLVNVDDLVKMVEPQNVFVRCGFVVRTVNAARCRGVQSFIHQGGLARARYTCDTS